MSDLKVTATNQTWINLYSVAQNSPTHHLAFTHHPPKLVVLTREFEGYEMEADHRQRQLQLRDRKIGIVNGEATVADHSKWVLAS